MPRPSVIRIDSLDELARQLRYARPRSVARQVRAVILLAQELVPGRAYEKAWVFRSITGFAPESLEEGALVGEALRAELSAFVERISAQARLRAEDLEQPVITLDQLTERWGVTRRTIERYRRRGLIAVRLFDDQGRMHISFPVRSVERFEREHAALLADARAFARRPPGERDRSVERRRRTGARGRALAFRSWRRGIGVSEVAHHLSLTRAAAGRLVHRARAEVIEGALRAPFTPASVTPAAAARALASEAARLGLGEPGDDDVASLARAAAWHEAASEPRERTLAIAYHALMARAHADFRALGPRPRDESLDEIETALRWAVLLKIELVRAQRPLIVRTIEERAGAPLLAFPPSDAREWCAVAFRAADSAVDRFDPSGRGRLAAPLSLSLARALSTLTLGEGWRGRAMSASIPMPDWSLVLSPEFDALRAPSAVLGVIRGGKLPGEAEAALRHRFGLSLAPPNTLRDLRQRLGVSASRISGWIRLARRMSAET